MKLSLEEINFIDTYLKKSDILFTDVRMEMVDHVATEVETAMQDNGLSFYDAFKNYMVANKKRLLHTNRKFMRLTDKKVWRKILKNLIAPWSLLAGIILFFIFEELKMLYPTSIKAFPFALLIVFSGYYLLTVRTTKQRFSALERLGMLFILIYQIAYILMNPFVQKNIDENNFYLNIIWALLICTVGAGFKTMLDFQKEYKNLYKSQYTK